MHQNRSIAKNKDLFLIYISSAARRLETERYKEYQRLTDVLENNTHSLEAGLRLIRRQVCVFYFANECPS